MSPWKIKSPGLLKRSLGCWCCIFFYSAIILAQTPLADSLTLVLRNTTEGKARIQLLLDLSWEITEIDPDAAESKLGEALALAQQYKDLHAQGMAWNGLGAVQEVRQNYSEAKAHYEKALDIRRKLGNLAEVSAALNNLATMEEFLGNLNTSLELRRESVRLLEQYPDKNRLARAYMNLAALYQEMGNYPLALPEMQRARLIFEELQDPESMAKAYTQIGHIRFELDQYQEAYIWYKKSLDLREKLGEPKELSTALNDFANALDESDSSEVALNFYFRALDIRQELGDTAGVATIYTNLGDAYKHIGKFNQAIEYLSKALEIREKQGNLPGIMEIYNNMGDVHRRAGRLALALDYTVNYLALARQTNDGKYIQRAYKDLATIYAAQGNYPKAYEFRVRYDSLRYARLSEQTYLDMYRSEATTAEQAAQIAEERRQHDRQVRDLQIREATILRNALAGGALGLALLAALLFNRNRIRARANRALAAQNVAIERERQRADTLLRNILPEETAAELKAHNSVKPVRYESVTVLFSDFKDFTKIAENLTPEELVAELDACFRLFDKIVEQFGLEKIKTIGDAYMCAGGLPKQNNTHPEDTVNAALAMQSGLSQLMHERKLQGRPVFEMRIGIHSGPVVAGVVGSHKFAYDIWGDAVNTAARLEQGGEAGRINISHATYLLVKSKFQCYYRGNLAAKNKGEIAMYFVSGPIAAP